MFLCLTIIIIIIISLLANREPKPTTANQLAEFHSRWREGSDWKLQQMEGSLYFVIKHKTQYGKGSGYRYWMFTVGTSSTLVHTVL